MPSLIQPYDPNWKTEFEKLQQVLASELKIFDIDIQHFGSTSIPELYAKPVLDIDIILHNKTMLEQIAATLEGLGYSNKGEQGITGRFAFRQQSAFTPITELSQQWQAHHLYVCFSDSLALKKSFAVSGCIVAKQTIGQRIFAIKISVDQRTRNYKRRIYKTENGIYPVCFAYSRA